jgi:uncharacterized repeat protein (TIGR03843 family)
MDANRYSVSTGAEETPDQAIGIERAVEILSQGQVELTGQVMSSSNIIFLARVIDGDDQTLAIYKPRQGERPLWDFPHGTLCQREVATYVLSQRLGWPLVPPAVLRDGPYGLGALQLFIDADYEANYFSLQDKRLPHLLPIALFDVLVNNADRKGGHVLLDHWDRIWAIDNALTFHPEPKLRTVIWDFAGEPIPDRYLADLQQLQQHLSGRSRLRQALQDLLSKDEIIALQARLAELIEWAKFPQPDPTRRQVPWPIV